MKKFIALLLAVLVLAVNLSPIALSETIAEPAEPVAPLVDLTGVVIAVALAAFEFLLAWIARAMIPPIRAWLETHTTEKEKNLLWDAVCKLVDAAEQTIRGPGQGEKRLAYVEAGLQQRGFRIDDDLIEAAVKRMKERVGLTLAEGLDLNAGTTTVTLTPVGLDESGEPDLNVEHWSLAQLRTFFRINAFPDPGYTTREQYIDFLLSPPAIPAEAEARPVKDYCDLDDMGNRIPEEPESRVE